MISKKKKNIIFDEDAENEILGEKRFIKFLDDDKSHAIFYMPLIAPKYFDDYLVENKIVKAYEITSEDVLIKNYDKVYTFTENYGVYDVSKGIEAENKLILPVDINMEIDIDLPKYSYVIKKDSFYLKPFSKHKTTREYCFVANEEYVNPSLKNIMIKAVEIIPGILNTKGYDFTYKIKTKKYKPR